MPMRRMTLRFAEHALDVVEQEAVAAGETTAQFIRMAAIGRAYFLRGRRLGEDDAMAALERVASQLGELRDNTDG